MDCCPGAYTRFFVFEQMLSSGKRIPLGSTPKRAFRRGGKSLPRRLINAALQRALTQVHNFLQKARLCHVASGSAIKIDIKNLCQSLWSISLCVQ